MTTKDLVRALRARLETLRASGSNAIDLEALDRYLAGAEAQMESHSGAPDAAVRTNADASDILAPVFSPRELSLMEAGLRAPSAKLTSSRRAEARAKMPPEPAMYFALLYDLVPDYLERRKPLRAEHLALAERYRREGKLLIAGAFDPPDGALLAFRAGSAADVEAFARADPYVANGLVTRWRVRPWTVVIGGEAPAR